jgi:hypothetical protein
MAATTRTSRPRGWPPQAEEVDREAHLEGQARTYGDADMANDRQSGGTSTDDFVPGSRRMPTR